MCKKAYFGLLFFFAVFFAFPAFASDTLFEYYNSGDDDADGIRGTTWIAQTFTPSEAHEITSAKLKLSASLPAGAGICSLYVRAVDGDHKPTGLNLCSGTYDCTTLTSTPTLTEITFSSGTCELEASTEYALQLSANGTEYVFWRFDSTSPTYAGGSYVRTLDGGSTWTVNTAYDLMFEEYGLGDVEAPATSSYIVLSDTLSVYHATPTRPADVYLATSTDSIDIDFWVLVSWPGVPYASPRLADIFVSLYSYETLSGTQIQISADQTASTTPTHYTASYDISGFPKGNYIMYFIYRIEDAVASSTYYEWIEMSDEDGDYLFSYHVPDETTGGYLPVAPIAYPEIPTSSTTTLGWFGNEIVNVLRYIFVPSFEPYNALLLSVNEELKDSFPFGYFTDLFALYDSVFNDYDDATSTEDVSITYDVFDNPLEITLFRFSWVEDKFADELDDIQTFLTWVLWLGFAWYLYSRTTEFKPAE